MELIMMWTAKRHRDPSQMISTADMITLDGSWRTAQDTLRPAFAKSTHLPVAIEE